MRTIQKIPHVCTSLLLLAILFNVTIKHCAAADKTKLTIDEAIAKMRNIKPEKMTKEEQEKSGEELSRAWLTLLAGGNKAAEALNKEAAKVINAKEEDDFFLLGASSILFTLRGVKEAENIAKYWEQCKTLSLNANYSYHTAIEAAKTQNPAVLPMLKMILREDKLSYFVPAHYLKVEWPLTLYFTWGIFGPKGVPALEEAIQEENCDPVTIRSVCILASMWKSLPLLEKIRKFVNHEDEETRGLVIDTIGLFGHPDDFELINKALEETKDFDDFKLWCFAAAKYQDLRFVKTFLKRLGDENPDINEYVCHLLFEHFSWEGMQAIEKTLADEKIPLSNRDQLQAKLKKYKTLLKEHFDIDLKEMESFDDAKRKEEFMKVWNTLPPKFQMKPDDRKLTREELIEALDEWTKKKSIVGGKFVWVEDRHVIDAATPDDLDKILNLVAACLRRVSDECLYEVQTMLNIAQHISRKRYRTHVGLCEKVELPK